MTPVQWRAHFEQLLGAFPEMIRRARGLRSPNPDDDLFVRLGIVGFQAAAPLTAWEHHHGEVIRDLRRGAYADEELAWYEDAGMAVAAFACLSYGLMLGLDEAGLLDERDREVGQALLPGFMLEDLQRVADAGRLAKGDG